MPSQPHPLARVLALGKTQQSPAWMGRLGETWPGKLASALAGAVMEPGRVMREGVDDSSIDRMADLAGMVTLGAGAVPAGANQLRAGIKAYHGSPHDFDRFDMSKIGTGQGQQVYGRGMYLAENPAVAKKYRDDLAGGILPEKPEALAQSVLDVVGGDRARAVAELQSRMKGASIPEFKSRAQQAIDLIESDAPLSGGRMYEATINASPEEFLDWDAPFSQQSQRVQEAINGIDNRSIKYSLQHGTDITGASVANQFRDDPSALRAAGIKGIRYKDQGSRGAEGGTSNYVVFDADVIEILRKYGIAGLAALGGAGAIAGSGGEAQAGPQRHPLAAALARGK